MPKKTTGFQEGTTHITTGDTIKEGDHRRNKAWCKFYSAGFCTKKDNSPCNGSSHCEYYDDGIALSTIIESSSYKVLKDRMQKFVEDLQFLIPLDTLEGNVIKKHIMKKNNLVDGDIERLEKQKAKCAQLQYESNKRIEEHNRSLKRKCLLAAIFIITIPFCLIYYENNKMDSAMEAEKIREKTIDKQLVQNIEQYKQELKKYSANPQKETPFNTDKNDIFLQKAITLFKNKEFDNSMFYVMKAINAHNTKAILWFAKMFHKGIFFEKNELYTIILILYASFLGDEKAKTFVFKK